METDPKLLECLFGHHQYSKFLTRDKDGHDVFLCQVCKRSGHAKWYGAYEVWSTYDERGNCTYKKWDGGDEIWYGYNKKGNWIYAKRSDGFERWKDNNGSWLKTKPKNWLDCREEV